MHKAIQYSIVLVTLIILISPAIGFDAFDQTVNQIKALEVELEKNQTLIKEQETFITEQLTSRYVTHMTLTHRKVSLNPMLTTRPG